MKEAKYQTKCPECGNIDVIGENETKQTVHCQRCYHHYDFKINDIKNRITKDSEGISSYLNVSIEEMDWMVDQTEKVDPLVKLHLWTIRRLPTKSLKRYALQELKNIIGDDHKYSEFIDAYLSEVSDTKERVH